MLFEALAASAPDDRLMRERSLIGHTGVAILAPCRDASPTSAPMRVADPDLTRPAQRSDVVHRASGLADNGRYDMATGFEIGTWLHMSSAEKRGSALPSAGRKALFMSPRHPDFLGTFPLISTPYPSRGGPADFRMWSATNAHTTGLATAERAAEVGVRMHSCPTRRKIRGGKVSPLSGFRNRPGAGRLYRRIHARALNARAWRRGFRQRPVCSRGKTGRDAGSRIAWRPS